MVQSVLKDSSGQNQNKPAPPPTSKAPPLKAKPPWLRVKAPVGKNYNNIKKMLDKLNLATVCQQARCPNMGECWDGGTATFMLMGEVCTRGCRFCNVKTGNPKGKIDSREPEKVGWSIAQMGLSYVVLTSVNRDDMEDQGAEHFGRTVETIKKGNPSLIIEILTPDFQGQSELIHRVVDSGPHVFAHNVETVERLTPKVRDPRAGYRQSLGVLAQVKKRNPTIYTKSSLMMGLGEKDQEILETMEDLRSVGCDVITFGQYLRPSFRHLKVVDYIKPERFQYWKQKAVKMGFLYCASGPLVRSSYKAGEFFMKAMIERNTGKNTHR